MVHTQLKLLLLLSHRCVLHVFRLPHLGNDLLKYRVFLCLLLLVAQLRARRYFAEHVNVFEALVRVYVALHRQHVEVV